MTENLLQALVEQHRIGSLRILVVDDDVNIIEGVRDILEDSGYLVEVALSATEAMEHLDRQIFSAMLVDYSLPDDNGINLSRSALKVQPALEFVLMTGHDRRDMGADILKAGMNMEFLRKPVDVAKLLSALERAIDRQCARLNIKRSKSKPETAGESHPLQTPRRAPRIDPVLPLEMYHADTSRTDAAPGQNIKHYLVVAAMVVLAFFLGWMSRKAQEGNAHLNSDRQIPRETPRPESVATPVPPPPLPVVHEKKPTRPLEHKPQVWTEKDGGATPEYYNPPTSKSDVVPVTITKEGIPLYKSPVPR